MHNDSAKMNAKNAAEPNAMGFVELSPSEAEDQLGTLAGGMSSISLPPGHVRVRQSGKIAKYVAYAKNFLLQAIPLSSAAGSNHHTSRQEHRCVIISGTGPAVTMAVSVAEILKRSFTKESVLSSDLSSHESEAKHILQKSAPNADRLDRLRLHQLNYISMQSTSLTYEPLEEGLEKVQVDKTEPHIQIRLAWNKEDLDGWKDKMKDRSVRVSASVGHLNGYQAPGCTAGCQWLKI